MAHRASSVELDDDDPLFAKDGVPVKFCFHRSVTQGRAQITRDVERHGGRIVSEEQRANVLLVDEEEDIAFLRRRYYNSTERYRLELYIEPRGFVQTCIRSGSYRHVGPVKQGMPGRPPGEVRIRIPFTEEDRDRLAHYLATRFPTRDGRMGNNAYKDLVRLGQTNDPEWTWARRHTFHSWREHYKMHPVMMDARIEVYQEKLENHGHHFGQDPRRHDHGHLRVEVEEEEEEESSEEGERRQEVERRERQRRAQGAVRGRARDRRVRPDQDVIILTDSEDDRVQQREQVQERRPVKRKRVHERQQDIQESRAKRARVSEVSPNKRRVPAVEAGRGKSSPVPKQVSDDDELPEIEGSDLFGDREYEDKSRFKFDDDPLDDFPMPFSPSIYPIAEQDGLPPSTQTTLVASPLTAARVAMPPPVPAPTWVAEAHAPAHQSFIPPSSQQTMVATQERVVVQRARVRGPSAQPGPSVPKEKRTRGGVTAVEAPYRNTRARSRSVDPQPQGPPMTEPEPPRRRGKGKVREKALVSIEEAPKEVRIEEDVEPASAIGGLTTGETFEDERVVENLLATSLAEEDDVGGEASWSVHDEKEGEEDAGSGASQKVHDRDGEDSVGSGEDEDGPLGLSSEPSDSDDAETHGALMRGDIREGSGGGDDVEIDQGQGQGQDEDQDRDDEDEDDEDEDEDSDSDSEAEAARIENMANRSLHAALAPVPAHAPTPTRPRVTRSQTRTQAQIYAQTGTQAAMPTMEVFPSPGTKARAVVDRFQEEERRMPYEPPEGSRARAMRGRTVKRG